MFEIFQKLLGRYSCRWFGHVHCTKPEMGTDWIACSVPGCTLQFKVYGMITPVYVGYLDDETFNKIYK